MLQKLNEKRNSDARISMNMEKSEPTAMRQLIEKMWKETTVMDNGYHKKVDNKRAGPRYGKSGAGGVILSSRGLV